jgi:hypothetical protein
VGDMIYGTEDDHAIDKAVRLVIMLIMVVFDPLAVLLLIAANMSMTQKNIEPVEKDDFDEPNKWFDKIRNKVKILDKDRIEIEKENITSIVETPTTEERVDPVRIHETPGVYHEHHDTEMKKKLEPKYDYNAELAFKEKTDGNKF